MDQGFLYTLAFIRRGDEVLLINRIKAPWFGMWNGVGGKRERGESPDACIRREIREETGIDLDPASIRFGGTLTWNDDFKAASNGLYLYFAEVDPAFSYPTPTDTPEGILDWKPIRWTVDRRNQGVATNIRHFLPTLLGGIRLRYHCVFAKDRLVEVVSAPMEEEAPFPENS
ncbi:MAG: 8-oxo-dGTP diphosphatase [Candidatus Izemoplasmatales bacterium]